MKLATLCLLLLAAPILARPDADPLKQLVKDLNDAAKAGDTAAFDACIAKAEELKGSMDEKKFDPVVKAIGKVTGHKDEGMAAAAIGALGKLKVKGSSKLFGKQVAPPAKVAEEKLPVHLAAIRAAGEIQDEESVKGLLNNLDHAMPEIATASAEALALFKGLEAKDRLDLLGDLIKELEKLERKVAGAKQEEAKAAADKVRAAVGAALHGLTGKEGVSTAEDWEKWLKEEGRRK